MDGIEPNATGLEKTVRRSRFEPHDRLEQEVMDLVRPYTDRKHLPDRWVSFSGIICPFDVKTTVHCEDKSHNEYLRLVREGFYGMWIVYRDYGTLYADWFNNLRWGGPYPPRINSRSGDPYYRIGGGRLLDEFLRCASREIVARRVT